MGDTAKGTISFETGVRTYTVNGAFEARFNPADEAFAERLHSTFEALDQLHEEGWGEGPEGTFERMRKLDEDMRGRIDGLLGEGASDALFGTMSSYAIADGLPLWMNLVLALYDEVSGAFEAEFGRTDPRFERLKAKYDPMMRKYRKRP